MNNISSILIIKSIKTLIFCFFSYLNNLGVAKDKNPLLSTSIGENFFRSFIQYFINMCWVALNCIEHYIEKNNLLLQKLSFQSRATNRGVGFNPP